MNVAKIEIDVDVFGREWWKLYDYKGRWIRFRRDIWAKADAVEAFHNYYDFLMTEF